MSLRGRRGARVSWRRGTRRRERQREKDALEEGRVLRVRDAKGHAHRRRVALRVCVGVRGSSGAGHPPRGWERRTHRGRRERTCAAARAGESWGSRAPCPWSLSGTSNLEVRGRASGARRSQRTTRESITPREQERKCARLTCRAQPNHLGEASLDPRRLPLGEVVAHDVAVDVAQPADVHLALERVVGEERVQVGVVLREEEVTLAGVAVDLGREGVCDGLDDAAGRELRVSAECALLRALE